MNYTPVIGLEIHVELNTMNTKMFCGCPANHFGVQPNTQVCPVCYGLPGALPVANVEGVRRTIKIGLAVGGEIARHSKFDRKNYFYPDLPKGYQISQYDQPLCTGGLVETSLGQVRLERVHLEEDTAKLQHVTLTPEEMQQAGVEHSDVSFVDFNRSGVALVEIVTKPDIHSGEQAREYAKNLVQILRYLGVSDCDMEKGSLRLEANISVQTEEEKANGTLPPYKVEVKNLNSFRFLERAINYEIARHSELRDRNELPKQETRGWNDAKGQTYSQRSKEDAEDYRYFPDPDIPPLNLSEEFIDSIRQELPEMSQAKVGRWVRDFGISEQNAVVLSADPEAVDWSEALLGAAKERGMSAQQVASAVVNKKVELSPDIDLVLRSVSELYKTEVVDTSELEEIAREIVSDPANDSAVQNYKNGKIQVIGVFIGQVMKKLGRKTDPKAIKEAVETALKKIKG